MSNFMDLPDPPYPSDINAKGWRLEIDYMAWERADCWTLLSEMERPFLVMMLLQSWRQLPCGSLPESDLLMSRLIGVDSEQWLQLKPRILCGWYLAANHRFYHPLMVERVEYMLRVRNGASTRQARSRSRAAATGPRNSTKKQQEVADWLATLPPERAQALQDELVGARAAGQTIVSSFAWLLEVNARWDEAGRPILRYGASERARRMAHTSPLEPTTGESVPRAEAHSMCVDLLAQLGKRRLK